LGNNRANLDSRPDKPPRPERPNRPDRWQNIETPTMPTNGTSGVRTTARINNFQVNRTHNWNSINARYKSADWPTWYGSATI
jgi:hypothetical protein